MRTGVKSRDWCCILIRCMNLIAPGGHSTAIYRAPNGWRSMVISTSYAVAHLREVALPTSGLILIGSSSLERATSSGILEIGPAKFPSNLFFAFMKAGERCHAAWNLSRLNC